MKHGNLQDRTKSLALSVIKLIRRFSGNRENDIIARQVVRSATSVGANYRSACKARSRAEFIAKMGISLEECDETVYWLEILKESNHIVDANMDSIIHEAQEITAILTASISTARKNEK